MRLAPPIFIFFFTFRLGVAAPGVMFVLVAFAPTFHKRIKTNGIRVGLLFFFLYFSSPGPFPVPLCASRISINRIVPGFYWLLST
jgi:hypothetical protein